MTTNPVTITTKPGPDAEPPASGGCGCGGCGCGAAEGVPNA